LKTQDANYEKNMKAKTGVGPQEYTVKLTQDLMNKQDIGSVDTVTGATSGSNEFKELVAAALTNAVKGSTTASTIPLVEAASYKDGTYKATFDKLDSHGWNAQVELTIKSNVITFCTFDYVDKDGNFKSKNAGYNVSMQAKSGTCPQTYVVQLAQSLLKVQSPLKVDTVTGATSSSSNFKELAEAALGHAQTGDQTTVVLPQKE
jgi:major membrane immunogen (membrane-anchored lipoprotein)